MPDVRPRRYQTDRGFEVFDEFTDLCGTGVRVQESSLATEAACWIFCDPPPAEKTLISPHLSVDMARRLRDALDVFIRERGGEG